MIFSLNVGKITHDFLMKKLCIVKYTKNGISIFLDISKLNRKEN